MIQDSNPEKPIPDSLYFSEMIGVKILSGDKKIGRLSDAIIIEGGRCPEITYLYVTRSFGYPPLLIPWMNVIGIYKNRIEVSVEKPSLFEGEPKEGDLLIRDYILDKKVIDLEDHEVEVVYDVRLLHRFGKMLLFEVDISRLGLLRRLGLKNLVSVLQRAGKEVDDLSIPWMYVQPLPSTISRFKGDVKLSVLKEKLEMMHPVDLADIFEDMDPEQRVMIFSELDTETASDTLEEIDPPIQREIVSSLKMEHVLALVDEMTPAQTADILTALSHLDAQEILDEMDLEKATKVRSILERSDETIHNYTTSEYITLPPDARVGQVQDEYPRLAKDKDVIMYLYIVDECDVLLGVIDIKDLLKADDDAKLRDIMVDDVITLTKDSTLKEAASEFSRYDFRALPVVNEEKKIIGVLPYRDVMKLRHHFLD